MIELKSTPNKTLNIFLKETNKALSKVLENISATELAQLGKAPKDLGELLSSFFKNGAATNSQQNQALLNLLKNNPTFQELSNVNTTLKSLLKSLSTMKEPLPQMQKLKTTLQLLTHDMQKMEAQELKNRVQNSGVFLESKLKNAPQLKEALTHDLKAQLLQVKEELQNANIPQKPLLMQHIDKLTLQIDYYQLLSHLSNASALYLPYSFEGFEEGSISIKKAKKEHYFCDIDLRLKKYGALHMRLGLFEKKQLRINIECEDEALRERIKTNLPELKKMLFSAGLHPQEITFLETNKTEYATEHNDINLGFEVKA
ncbi:hypothetical protein MNB_SM-6-358 [hydrothermal vent metagenome]|uniref:Flagellar hook-length control protein-like C-terminal domain-containing protein n=1 Tax=hydrothermal vent metagenome TaxID=652676 RepID=A0A1W1BHI1_9ZZZZ